MHSDGLMPHWSLERIPGLRQRPAHCRRVLYRDYQARPRRRHGRGCATAAHEPPMACSISRTSRHGRCPAARAADRAPARLRCAGPDAHRDRRVGDRAQRLRYAGGGRIEFAVEGRRAQRFDRRVDNGPGIADLDDAADGRTRRPPAWVSASSARRLMDAFEIASAREGTASARQACSRRAGAGPDTASMQRRARGGAGGPRPATARRNPAAEPGAAAHARRAARRQEELDASNPELEDTNRGVVALYAELDERDHLLRADEVEDPVPVEHEPRVPHAGELDPGAVADPARPHGRRADRRAGAAGALHRQAADQLGRLVNDLLDLRQGRSRQDPVRAPSSTSPTCSPAARHVRPLLLNDRERS